MENKYNNIRVVELSKYEAPIVQESNREDWVTYGENDSYFQYLIDRYTYSPTNNAIINNISRLIYGRGLKALDASAKPNEYANMITLFPKDETKRQIMDAKMLGQFAIQVIYAKDRKTIAKTAHIPIQLLRPEKCNKEGKIEAYYYSDNWQDTKKFKPKRIPAFGTSNEPLEILMVQPYSVGMKYFSLVDYQGALPYCKLEQEIADYLINEVQNGFSGTKIINFNNGIPTDEEMDETENKVTNKLTGSKGKRVIVSFNHSDAQKTTVDDIPLNDAPQHYEYLADECMRKIMLGHNVTSPLLFGVSSSNGFSSNADELKNSFVLYYNMVIRPYQDLIIDAYNQILAYNGIKLKLYFETLKPLEFQGADGKVEETQLSSQDDLKMILDEVDRNQLSDEWVMVDEREVGDDETDLDKNVKELKYFKVRYKYTGNKSPERDFCRAMMAKEDRLFRKEDIDAMSLKAVNAGFGENGANTYDIFKFKGGPRCHHKWARVTFMLDLNRIEDGYQEIGTRAAEIKGYKVTNPYEVSVYPNNLPLKGFSPNNPNRPKDAK